MSAQNLSVTTSCKLCRKLIYLEDEPVHSECVSAYENSLIDVVLTLQKELNDMRKCFVTMEATIETLKLALGKDKNENTRSLEVPVVDIPIHTLRNRTIAKSMVAKKNRNRPEPPLSPLVIANGTSPPQNVSVRRDKCNKTSTSKNSSASRSLLQSFASVVSSNSIQSITDHSVTVGDGPSTPKITRSVELPQQPPPQITSLPTLAVSNRRLRIAAKPPKNKSIYVSRLDIETDENEIKSYLSEVGFSDILKDLKIFKLNTRNQYFSSFKIICPEYLFDIITNSFSKDGAVAREFVYKNITKLPVTSKN